MAKIGIVALAFCTAGICAAQPHTTTAQTTSKHFRLTFVLTYPHGQQPSQSFALDVPVTPNRPGISGMSMAAGSTGQVEGSVRENLQCSDVRESATGLAANVAFAMESVPAEPLPGSTEPRHRQIRFQRQIDLVLGKPTKITEEMHVIPLGKGPAIPNVMPPAPQITVTAIEL